MQERMSQELSTQNEKLSFFNLPNDVLVTIASQLRGPDVCRLLKVNNRFSNVFRQELLWKALLQKDFGIDKLPKICDSFKQYYQWHYEVLKASGGKIKFSEQELKSAESSSLAQDEFKEIDSILNSLYLNGNLVAGRALVKLYAEVHTPLYNFSLDSSAAYNIGLELIEKHQYCITEVQKYLERILDGTTEVEDEIYGNFLLYEILVRKLIRGFQEKTITLSQFLQLPPKDLRLLTKVYLPYLIVECKDENEKSSSVKLQNAILGAVKEDYTTLDPLIQQDVSSVEIASWLEMPVYQFVESGNELSSESDSEVDDFVTDSEDEDNFSQSLK